jgi:hypothetical protein
MTGKAVTAPEVGDTTADVLRAAYYYGLMDGHQVIETSVVLMAAARNDDELARPALGVAVAEARGVLAARAATDGGAADASVVQVPCPYAPSLREARWWVLREVSPKDRARLGLVTDDGRGGPVWGKGVCEALDRAGGAARTAGVARVGVAHLLLALLNERDGSIRALAAQLGLDVAAASGRVRAAGLEAEASTLHTAARPPRAHRSG